MERDKFLDPEEAKEFGIIDEVVNQRRSAVAKQSEKSLVKLKRYPSFHIVEVI